MLAVPDRGIELGPSLVRHEALEVGHTGQLGRQVDLAKATVQEVLAAFAKVVGGPVVDPQQRASRVTARRRVGSPHELGSKW